VPGPKSPDPVARDFNPATPLNAYRGEAPSALRLGSVSDRRTTPQCGADGQQSVVPASTQRDNLFVNYIALQPKHSKCAEAFG
jgi:hypothetical protein